MGTEISKHPQQNGWYDHLKLLERLAESNALFALVEGKTDMGKTTLIKKIAYDWATNQTENFQLVLTVPLKDVQR